MTWIAYLTSRAGVHPLATLDTLLKGLTSYPFDEKWDGLRYVAPWFAALLRGSSVVGLFLLLCSARGRLLAVVLFSALAPFAFTWQIPGGAGWRFTLVAYPFYLIASFFALSTAASLVLPSVRARLKESLALHRRRWIVSAAGMILVLAGLPFVPRYWRYLLVREAALRDGAFSIVASPENDLFFGENWYDSVEIGNITGRYSHGARALIRFPVFMRADSRLTFRLQPYSDQPQPARTVEVSINATPVSVLSLKWNPEKVGSYEATVPKEVLHDGFNRIELKADGSTTVPPTESRFVGLKAGQDVAFFLWYVRVTPTTH
jgi:hypothetical protein